MKIDACHQGDLEISGAASNHWASQAIIQAWDKHRVLKPYVQRDHSCGTSHCALCCVERLLGGKYIPGHRLGRMVKRRMD